MIASTVALASHVLTSTLKVLHSVLPVLEYITPYWTMSVNKINFDTKHLAKGDPIPPYNGKLRIYNMRYCPYAQRAILALNAKQIDYEVVNINLMDKPDLFTSKSYFGKVPAIEIEDGVTIYESLIIVEYLDEVYPQRPLLNKDPVKRAFDKIIIEATEPIRTLYYKSIKNPGVINDASFVAYNKALDFIQEQLKQRGTKFLGGDLPGYADYMIWPFFERILLSEDPTLNIDSQKYSHLLEYFAEMFKDPAVSQYLIPVDILRKFMDFYSQGKPINYDMLLKD